MKENHELYIMPSLFDISEPQTDTETDETETIIVKKPSKQRGYPLNLMKLFNR